MQISSGTTRQSNHATRLKYSCDRIVAIAALTLLWPALAALYIAVRLDSPGPALFRQARIGQDGQIFHISKFRTMQHRSQHTGSGIYTSPTDPRVTRLGRVLRKTSLDELPQLFNVLHGDMSIVGPRPPLPHHPMAYAEYSSTARRRFLSRPGITGLAQVRGRNRLTWPERIILDVEYVDTWSLGLDLRIVLATIVSLVSRADVFSGRTHAHDDDSIGNRPSSRDGAASTTDNLTNTAGGNAGPRPKNRPSLTHKTDRKPRRESKRSPVPTNAESNSDESRLP